MNKYREKTRKQLRQEIKDLKKELYYIKSLPYIEFPYYKQEFDIIPIGCKHTFIPMDKSPYCSDKYIKKNITMELAKHLENFIEYEEYYPGFGEKTIIGTIYVAKKNIKNDN